MRLSRSLTLMALFILALSAFAGPGRSEQLVTQVSRPEVAITSSFQGETLTLFGQIQPDPGSTERFVEGPYHLIITVTGPLQDRVTRKKSNVFGVWLNTDEATFERFPSFYQVLSDARIADMTDAVTLSQLQIPLASQARHVLGAGWWDSLALGTELVRLMQKKGMFVLNEQGVIFRSNTFFFAQVNLPSDAPPGPYLVHSYLFKDGVLVADKTDGFSVRKIGFERFLGLAARQQPLFYGIVCVALAIFTGWLGGVVFRR
jgi:uncharacterized protein (TIGR02186 family)